MGKINNRINLSRHKKEWKIIFNKIEEFKIVDGKMTDKEMTAYFHQYVNKKMYSLSNDYKDCPDCILESLERKVKIQHYVNKDLYKIYKDISRKSKMPIATIVDKLIINPLIVESLV